MAQTYLITGASRGIGLEFAKQLSAKGHTVIATARNPDKADGLVSLTDNKKVFSVPLETTNVESVKSAIEKVKKIAPDGLDVLINNSGIACGREYNTLNTTPDIYMDVFHTNVVGTSNVIQAALPLLLQKEARKVINISSSVGSIEVGLLGDGMPAYGASKTALNYLSKAFATGLKDKKCIVVSIHPGWVQTDMGGEGAALTPTQSVSGMLHEIDNLTIERSGAFFDYDGKTLPF